MTNIVFKCEFCGKDNFGSKNACNSHRGKCKQNPNAKRTEPSEKWLNAMHARKGHVKKTYIEFKCDFCGKTEKTTKESATFHLNYCKSNPNRKVLKGHKHSEAEKKHLSECAKRNNFGGWHTSKVFEYNGIKLDSSYELTLAQDLDKNNVKWERPSPLNWKLDGSEHRYYPDFFLPEYNIYVDTKNDYLINNINPRFGITDVEKIKLVEAQNNVKILILDKNNLSWQCLLRSLSGR